MVRSVLLTALVLLILLNAQSLTIVIYESDRDTEDWQWHSNDSRTQIVIGFDSEQWVNTSNLSIMIFGNITILMTANLSRF